MRVLSLSDGMAGARFALDRLGVKPSAYYASEIEKWPAKVAKHNFPDIIHIGDVCNIKAKDYPNIDLLIGGSPCTSLSSAKGQKESGLEKGESTLFWRKRLYWTNIKGVEQPEDRGIFLKDIIEDGYVDRSKSYCLDATYYKGASDKHYLNPGHGRRQIVFHDIPEKSLCLTSSYYKACPFDYEEKSSRQLIKIAGHRQGERTFSIEGKAPTLLGNGGEFYAVQSMAGKNGIYRKLTVSECEKLQGVPVGATSIAPKTHAIKMLGNGFQIDTVAQHFIFHGEAWDNTKNKEKAVDIILSNCLSGQYLDKSLVPAIYNLGKQDL